MKANAVQNLSLFLNITQDHDYFSHHVQITQLHTSFLENRTSHSGCKYVQCHL